MSVVAGMEEEEDGFSVVLVVEVVDEGSFVVVVVEVVLVVELVEEGVCVVLVVVEGQTGSKLRGILFRTQFLPCT